MNYLAHARDVLDRPWVLAGTVLPDWVRIVDSGVRLRPWMVDGAVAAPGTPRAELHEGLARHFEDDAWFHATDAFREVTGGIAAAIRERHTDRPDRRMRASFYAHILLEMVLDAWILETRPGVSAQFTDAVLSLDPEVLVAETDRVSPRPVRGLGDILERFRNPGILDGYGNDREVARRLGVMGSRVRQPDLPADFESIVSEARALVTSRALDLLRHPPD